MADVQFEEGANESSYTSRTIFGAPQIPGMMNMLLKTGIAKNKEKAYKLMVSSVVVMTVLSLIIAFAFIRNPRAEVTTEDLILTPPSH